MDIFNILNINILNLIFNILKLIIHRYINSLIDIRIQELNNCMRQHSAKRSAYSSYNEFLFIFFVYIFYLFKTDIN